MTKEIYISSTPHETRLAVVEDDQLAEIYYERENEYTLAGSVYKGKVTRVLPGMQSAFVDIGLERDAFLYVTDFAEEQEDGEEYVPLTQNHSHSNGRESSNGQQPRASVASSDSPAKAGPAHAGNQPRREASPPGTGNPDNSGDMETGDDSGNGGRRWRGRRGRRRGRGNAPQHAQSPETSADIGEGQEATLIPGMDQTGTFGLEIAAPEAETSEPHSEHESGFLNDHRPRKEHQPSRGQTSPAEVTILPGESLSKYRRGEPAPQPSASTSASIPTSAAPSFQPSTMVTTPLAWDGSELLPGESISRYKNQMARTHEGHSAPSEAPHTETQPTLHAFSSPAAEVGATEDEAALTDSASQQEETHNIAKEPAAIPVHASSATDSSPFEEAEFEPTEASASYRLDPSAPSAYRQSSVAEPESQESPSTVGSLEESYPVTASPSYEVTQAPVSEHGTSKPSHAPEPFFGEAVPIAQPVHTQEEQSDSVQASVAPVDTNRAAETSILEPFEDSWANTEEASGDEDRKEEEANPDDSAPDKTLHAFDPGHGVLEEEMIDEEEADSDAAHAPLEDAEYDDLIEETLDVQMDSGLLSELVRDQHIEQRTRFVDEPGTEEEEFDEGTGGFSEESGEIELEEDTDTEEDETDSAASDAIGAPAHAPRSPRRGNRGRQRPGQGQGGDRRRMRRATAQTSNLPAITELLKPNQEILVQIAKEPIARKGARITSHIALPGRFLVFMPTVNHVGVSRKISSDEERQRLKQILLSEKGAAGGGFIVRTAAASASEEDLRADIRFLLTLWTEMRQRAENSKPPALIYHDLSLVERILRDQVTDNFSAIWVDSETDYERVLRFLNRFEPSLVRRVKLYTKETPLFEQFGIQEEINQALRSKVWLKSGGSIVINQTEALVAIDINTGKYVGKTARLEDTILKTNLDAIPEIVRQIRLRDLGGIIVIDFIDMDERKNRNKVMQALEDALKSDRAPSKVLQFNDFGLVAITRKRVKQSLERTLSVPCSICTGTGMVKGPLTVCNEIYIELRKMHRNLDRGDVLLRVHPEVVKQLKAANGRWLSEMEEMSGKTVIVKSDASLHPEQFDIH